MMCQIWFHLLSKNIIPISNQLTQLLGKNCSLMASNTVSKNQPQQNVPVIRRSPYDFVETYTQGCLNAISDNFEVFNLLVFEFFGMVIFTFCVIWGFGLINYPGYFITYAGMLISLILSGSFGCGHINPAITFACMIKKEGRVSILKGISFVFVQFVAAFVGTFIAWGAKAEEQILTAPFPFVHDLNEPLAMLNTFFNEFIGSLLFVLIVLILTSSDTTFAHTVGQVWAAVPLALIAVCVMMKLALGTNPAQALAFQVAYYAFVPNTYNQLQCIWSVIIGASLGGVFAGLIFQFIYRPYAVFYRKELLAREEERKQYLVTLINNSIDSPSLRQRQTELSVRLPDGAYL